MKDKSATLILLRHPRKELKRVPVESTIDKARHNSEACLELTSYHNRQETVNEYEY